MQPDILIKGLFEDANTQTLVKSEIIEHNDWVELDRGTIAFEQAVDRGAIRTGLPPDDVERLLDAVPPSLTPIEATIELIQRLNKTDNRLYVLSNMHLRSIAHLEAQYKIWDMFEGIVISSRIQMVKPERQIYEYLLTMHKLEPSETVFIDDLQENLAAAASMGIQTIRFVDAAQCGRALAGYSVRVD